jgi:hypothetical protein
MKVSEIARHPIRSFRTAPFGGFIVASQFPGMIGEAMAICDQNYLEAAGLLPISVAGLTIGGLVMAKQFRLRDRIETSLETHGFDERVIQKTRGEWCARQTALVACEAFDLRAQCEAYFAEQPRSEMALAAIPHF